MTVPKLMVLSPCFSILIDSVYSACLVMLAVMSFLEALKIDIKSYER